MCFQSSTVQSNIGIDGPSYMPARNIKTGCHSPISFYGCSNLGFIKSICPKCLLKKESASVNAIQRFTCLASPVALLDIEVYEADGEQSTSPVQKAAVPIATGGRTFLID
ncbi:hypothetical protein TNCV_3317701 [Trichonephila clavipes]|nr:hypothetical protein TNCV_3317701 [Trichonephila clavipes]